MAWITLKSQCHFWTNVSWNAHWCIWLNRISREEGGRITNFEGHFIERKPETQNEKPSEEADDEEN